MKEKMHPVRSLSTKREKELLTLSETLGITFTDLSLLDQALTHTSYANERKGDYPQNERLEFLGDAVLELVSSTYLFHRFPELPEGELTKTRAGLVCSESLAGLALGLGLGGYLLLGHGEEMGGGRTRQTNLEDVFEAVIGAVYEDQGFDAARSYVLRVMQPAFAKIGEGGPVLKDWKTILQEIVFQQKDKDIVYELIGESGPDHAKEFSFQVRIAGHVMGEGKGQSKKEAEQRAALEALRKMGKA